MLNSALFEIENPQPTDGDKRFKTVKDIALRLTSAFIKIVKYYYDNFL